MIIKKKKNKWKVCMILLCFITNYENDEKIKQEKIELLSEKKEYFIKIIPLYTQYYSNIKIPENYIGHTVRHSIVAP